MKLALLNRDCLKAAANPHSIVWVQCGRNQVWLLLCSVSSVSWDDVSCVLPSKMDMHNSIWGESFQNSREKTCRRGNDANFLVLCSFCFWLCTNFAQQTGMNLTWASMTHSPKKQIQLKKLKPSLMKNNPHSLRAPVRSFTDETCEIFTILLVLLFFNLFISFLNCYYEFVSFCGGDSGWPSGSYLFVVCLFEPFHS